MIGYIPYRRKLNIKSPHFTVYTAKGKIGQKNLKLMGYKLQKIKITLVD